MDKQIEQPLSPNQIDDKFHNDKNIKKHIRIINTSKVSINDDLNFLMTGNISDLECNINKRKGKYIDNILILYTPVSSYNSGHFQMLCKNNNILYFFDSYGHNYKYLIDYVNNNSSEVRLNDNFGNLVLNANLPIVHNSFPYQTNNYKDDSCGYHSTVCGLFFITAENPNFDTYKEFIDKSVKSMNLDGEFKYDDVVIKIFDSM